MDSPIMVELRSTMPSSYVRSNPGTLLLLDQKRFKSEVFEARRVYVRPVYVTGQQPRALAKALL